jgi:hypothetical protein
MVPVPFAPAGRVLAKRNMGPHLVLMGGVWRKDPAKVLRVERDEMILHPGRAALNGRANDALELFISSFASIGRA